MAAVDKSTIDKFIEKLRGCHAVMRKLVSISGWKPFKRRRLKREFRRLDDAAYDEAINIEERSHRAICADDIMELGAIICRTTNQPQEALYEVLALLEVEVTEC